MKKVLITGAAGFLGSHLTKKYLDLGYRVVGFDDLSTGRMKNLDDVIGNSRFSFVNGTILENIQSQLVENGIGDNFDIILNMACPASPPKYQSNPVKTLMTSVLGVDNLMDYYSMFGNVDSIFFHASTSEIYGDPVTSPQREEDWGNVNPIGLRSCYDEGKRAAEALVMDYQRMDPSLNIRIGRIFNTYGPNMDPEDGRVVSNFICQALTGKPITVYGTGSQTRSFCYVDDLIEGIAKLVMSNYNGPVNIGNPDEFTINELASLIIDKIQSNIGNGIEYLVLPSDDPRQRKPDISLAKSVMNWEPKVKLDVGIDKTIEYFRKELKNEK